MGIVCRLSSVSSYEWNPIKRVWDLRTGISILTRGYAATD